jgi:hypothetical protein
VETLGCIHDGSLVALYNRINSQTMRTKYLTLSERGLRVSNSKWSVFRIDRCVPTTTTAIRYGEAVTLTDIETGVETQPFILQKVEKGTIARGNRPILELQKLCLEAVPTFFPPTASDVGATYLKVTGADYPGGSCGCEISAIVDNNSNDCWKLRNSTCNHQHSCLSHILSDRFCWTIVGIGKQLSLSHVPLTST